MIAHKYTIPGSIKWDGLESEPLYVFVFVTDPYREVIGLHTYHKYKLVWACNYGGAVRYGVKRARQIMRACRLSCATHEIEEVV